MKKKEHAHKMMEKASKHPDFEQDKKLFASMIKKHHKKEMSKKKKK